MLLPALIAALAIQHSVQKLSPGDTLIVPGNVSVVYLDEPNGKSGNEVSSDLRPEANTTDGTSKAEAKQAQSNSKWYWLAAGTGAAVTGLAVYYFTTTSKPAQEPHTIVAVP